MILGVQICPGLRICLVKVQNGEGQCHYSCKRNRNIRVKLCVYENRFNIENWTFRRIQSDASVSHVNTYEHSFEGQGFHQEFG